MLRLTLVALLAPNAACMVVSMNTRPHVLPDGELRVGLGQGWSRDVGVDFAIAEPDTSDGRVGVAIVNEVTAHYGLGDGLDVGLRLRPFGRGAKAEGLVQILDGKEGPVSVAVGLGLDRFSRSRIEVSCEAGGCFYRAYEGFMVDVPVVVGRRLAKWGTVFGALKYNHLWVGGTLRYESENDAFEPLVIQKRAHQAIAAWTIGLELRFGPVHLTPQMHGATVRLPSGDTGHMIYPALDAALVF